MSNITIKHMPFDVILLTVAHVRLVRVRTLKWCTTVHVLTTNCACLAMMCSWVSDSQPMYETA